MAYSINKKEISVGFMYLVIQTTVTSWTDKTSRDNSNFIFHLIDMINDKETR